MRSPQGQSSKPAASMAYWKKFSRYLFSVSQRLRISIVTVTPSSK